MGIIIKKSRKSLGITQQQLAYMTNISQSKISKIENGFLVLSVQELIDVLHVFGMKLEIKRL